MINIVNPNAVSGNLLVFYRHKCDCFLVCKCNHILVPDGIRADSLQHAIRNKSICLNGNASVCILSYLKCRIFQFQIFDWNKCLEFFLGNLLSVLFILIFDNKEYAVITTCDQFLVFFLKQAFRTECRYFLDTSCSSITWKSSVFTAIFAFTVTGSSVSFEIQKPM